MKSLYRPLIDYDLNQTGRSVETWFAYKSKTNGSIKSILSGEMTKEATEMISIGYGWMAATLTLAL